MIVLMGLMHIASVTSTVAFIVEFVEDYANPVDLVDRFCRSFDTSAYSCVNEHSSLICSLSRSFLAALIIWIIIVVVWWLFFFISRRYVFAPAGLILLFVWRDVAVSKWWDTHCRLIFSVSSSLPWLVTTIYIIRSAEMVRLMPNDKI